MWILNLVSWILFSVRRELKRFLWCGQIRFRHLPSTVNKSTMLGHGLVRADSENIVTNYRLFHGSMWRVNSTGLIYKFNTMTVFLFINNSFIKKNNNKEVRGAIIQYATMCGIWHFNFFFSDSLHLGYIVWSNARYWCQNGSYMYMCRN